MQQYQDLIRSIVDHGERGGSRQGGYTISHPVPPSFVHDMRTGMPFTTTKKLFIRGVVAELEMFVNGASDIRFLWQQGVHIWDGDWLRFQSNGDEVVRASLEGLLRTLPDHKCYPNDNRTGGMPTHEWVAAINEGGAIDESRFSLGQIYGVQWRGVGENDHLANAIKMLKINPTSRQNIVSAWNGDAIKGMALPPCHTMFQLRRKGPNSEFLDLTMFQRSCDSFLGLPFNIASYALLMEYICLAVGGNVRPRFLKIDFGDLHLYEEHLPQVNELLSREPRQLPVIGGDGWTYTIKSDLLDWSFSVEGYDPHPPLKAQLIV